MSGRHRRAQATAARRALLGTVPVLGLAGAAGVLGMSDPGTTPVADSAPVDPPVTTEATTPVAAEQVPSAAPEATAAVSGAAAAADRTAGNERARERSYITSVVNDVQADARSRDADAARTGQDRLDAFQQEQERRQQPEQGTAQPAPDVGESSTPGGGTCDLSGLPLLGGPTGPDDIVGRDCGLIDPLGHQRSGDPWIDGQLLSGGEDS